MRGGRSVVVEIGLLIQEDGLCHWHVTTSEELQTIHWADDGTTEDARKAIAQACRVAGSELLHVVQGGSVLPRG